jgi:pilus assembly protein CpaB
MSRRTIALVAAVVLAAVATFALISYVQNARDKNLQGAQLVKVFVAKDTIPAGVSGDAAISQSLVKEDSRPQQDVPTGAITSLDEIRGKVAATNIIASEVIVSARFVAPGQAGGGLPVPANRQAISIQVGIPDGVSNFIRTGDRISVIGHIKVSSITVNGRPTGVSIGGVKLVSGAAAKYLVQDAEVLAVGQRVITTAQNGQTSESTNQPTNQILLTIAVTALDAERLVFMIKEGDIYLTLVPAGQKPQKTPGRVITNEFGK